MLCVADFTAFDEVSPRVRANTIDVFPRPTTLKTTTTLAPTSASDVSRTTFELYRRAILQTRPVLSAARGSATATSWLGLVVTDVTNPRGSAPTGVESPRAAAANASATPAPASASATAIRLCVEPLAHVIPVIS